jgi:hypothetical protein
MKNKSNRKKRRRKKKREKKTKMSNVPDLELFICSLNEIKITDLTSGEVRQKIVSLDGGGSFQSNSTNKASEHFSMKDLLNIGCLLHDAEEFKTSFRDPKAIERLGWVLVNKPNRKDVVTEILNVMRIWYDICANDATCIPAPTLDFLNDSQNRKRLAELDGLKRRLITIATQRATDLNNRQQSTSDLDKALLALDQARQDDRTGQP